LVAELHDPEDAEQRAREPEPAFVAACRARDPSALDRFYRDHVGVVERSLGRLVGPTADLEDLVQSTFVQAIRSFPTYRGEASLKTWLVRIAVHVALNELRRGVRRSVPLELLPPAQEPADQAPLPDRVIADRQTALRLHRLLDKLTPPKRIAFLLYAVLGHSVEEVAALMGSGRATTRSRIWFARRELAVLLRKDPRLRAVLADVEWTTKGNPK
jgi:RNA polymerase sigma-70 factor, ECF subfamily